MTLFFPIERATLLIPSGTEQDPDRKHLFILLNNPVTDEKLVLLVSLSTLRPDRPHDPTCIITPADGAHDFVQRASFVDYSKARIEQDSVLLNGVNAGRFIPKGTIERGVFTRILQGVLLSPRTPLKCKKFVEQYVSQDIG